MRRYGKWFIGFGLAIYSLAHLPHPLRADPDSAAPPKKTAQDAKADALARAAGRKALRQAVTALTSEYEKHANDPTVPLREKSNYFTENPAPAITVDAIMSALEGSDGPPAESCYIKWQLLSGLPAKADDQLAPRIGDLYSNAPGPFPNPSLTSMQKSQLDTQMMRLTSDQETMVNDAWKKHIDEWAAGNAPILKYSEALYNMLPESLGATTLALQDAYQHRASAGVDCEEFINQVLSQTRDWAVSATVPQLQAAAGQFTRVINLYSKTFPPQVYTTVHWDDQAHSLKWHADPIKCVSQDAVTAFRKFLTDQINTTASGGGIQIKPAN